MSSVQWACDYCYTKMPTLEAATAHEATCSKRLAAATEAAAVLHVSDGGVIVCVFCGDTFSLRSDAERHEGTCSFKPPSFVAKPWAPGQDRQGAPLALQPGRNESWRCDFCHQRFEDYAKCEAHENACGHRRLN